MAYIWKVHCSHDFQQGLTHRSEFRLSCLWHHLDMCIQDINDIEVLQDDDMTECKEASDENDMDIAPASMKTQPLGVQSKYCF